MKTTTATITREQFLDLSTALHACSAGLSEQRAASFEFRLTEQLLAGLRVPKRERYLGRLRLPDLAAIRTADFDQALHTLQRLAQLPA